MRIQGEVNIGYRDVFEDYTTVDIRHLLKEIPTRKALEVISFFLAQLHNPNFDNKQQFEFLNIWLERLPIDVHRRIYSANVRINQMKNSEIIFISVPNSLLLIEALILNHNDIIQENLTPKNELNLFKAYLLCSQKWIDKQNSFSPNSSLGLTHIQLIDIFIASQLPFFEINSFKNFGFQILKAFYFFRFCESDNQFSEYLKIFLNEYKMDSWKGYLKNILQLYVRKFIHMKIPSGINVDSNQPEIKDFLNNLCIDPNEFSPSDDFLSFRNKPVFKISESEYLFLNLNFLVDKIYQGIQFEFAKTLSKNSATYNGKSIKKPVDFLTIFAKDFSERGLFFKIMEYTFEKSGYMILNGDRLRTILESGEPDFYIRDKSKVYLFEFKNSFISGTIKHSYDPKEVKNELFKKLIENENGKPKGVTQLLNTIEKIWTGEFKKIESIEFNSIIIYPIIVYVDVSFGQPGINYVINQEFRKQLSKRGVVKTDNVKNVTMIHLDYLIKYQDLFREKALKINNCLNEYFDSLKTGKNFFYESLFSFEQFMDYKTRKLTLNPPKLLIKEIENFLPN